MIMNKRRVSQIRYRNRLRKLEDKIAKLIVIIIFMLSLGVMSFVIVTAGITMDNCQDNECCIELYSYKLCKEKSEFKTDNSKIENFMIKVGLTPYNITQ